MNPLHIPPYNLKNLYHNAVLHGRQKQTQNSWIRSVLNSPFWTFLCCIALVLSGCDISLEKSPTLSTRRGEYISRMHDEHLEIPSLEKKEPNSYPWERKLVGNFPKITKEHFRCKGKCLNPNKPIPQPGGPIYITDCEGITQHSLPVRNQKEFIFPILIELLNYVQAKTEKQVIITSGHRCQCHNRYVDSSQKNEFSKHMTGAEVDFYVQGMENSPEKVVYLLQAYFQENQHYQGLAEYREFQRWEKTDCDITTAPWYNKEVFIKLCKSHEGRNFDNAHPHPYIVLQVRYDRDRKERVMYSWEEAFHNYWRY
jgi:hypothetical protein